MTEADRTALAALAAEVDVIELAGRIIADPRRARVSTAAQLALASAVEHFWSVCVEAHVLISALALPENDEQGRADLARLAAIDAQASIIRNQLAALGGETSTQEIEAGHGNR